MPKLPRLSGWRVAALLERFGFAQGRVKGSHLVMKKATRDGTAVCVVPLHDELAVGTLRSVLRQAGITPDEFIAASRPS